MTNDRPVSNLPLVNYIVILPIIGHLYCMMSFLLDTLHCFIFGEKNHKPLSYILICMTDRHQSKLQTGCSVEIAIKTKINIIK